MAVGNDDMQFPTAGKNYDSKYEVKIGSSVDADGTGSKLVMELMVWEEEVFSVWA